MDEGEVKNLVIVDITGQVAYEGVPCVLALTHHHLTVYSFPNTAKDLKQKKLISYSTSDMIGLTYIREDGSVSNSATITTSSAVSSSRPHTYMVEVHFYPVNPPGCCASSKDGKYREYRSIKVAFICPEAVVIEWQKAVKNVSRGVHREILIESGKSVVPTRRSFLVVLNPKSGQGKSQSIWQNSVEPILRQTGIEWQLTVTQRANHAYELIRDHPALSAHYETIVVIGGDGIIYEIFNGLADRVDGSDALRSIAIAPIPGGTANGLIKSILFEASHAFSVINATFFAVKGFPRPLDISRVVTADGTVRHSFLSFYWGIIADIDILSEHLRWMGELRLHLAAIYFMLRKRMYHGRMKMKLIEQSTYRRDDPDVVGIEVNKLGPNDQVDNDGWLTIESDFVGILVAQVTHLGASFYLAPGARLDDGAFTVALVQNMSRLELLRLLLDADNGGIPKHPQVRIFQCSSYCFEAIPNEGIFSLDGEVVSTGLLQATLIPGAARIMQIM